MIQEPLFPAASSGQGWSAEGLFRLLSQRGIGPRKAVTLAKAFPDWSTMAKAGPAALRAVAGTAGERLAGSEEPDIPLTDGGARVIGWFDAEYPKALRALPDAPALLWVRGRLPAERGVAVVGTRDPSARGAALAFALAEQVTAQGRPVISGLALGVDTHAHRGCLESGGTTLAVLGSGIDEITPTSNRRLADEIVERGGAVLTEVPPGTRPSARTLVPRNRLQSALSSVVVVVECGIPSGTLSTVRFAVQQGRKVAVVAPEPGSEDDPRDAGNAALIGPAGCDPAVLGAVGELAAQIRARRPVADVVIRTPDDLALYIAGQ